MKRALFAVGLAASLLLGAIALLHATIHTHAASESSENPTMPTQISVSYHSRTNNTTDILRLQLETDKPYATGRVLIEDPSETPARTLRVVNLTADETRDVQLRTLPALFRVRGVIDLPGAPVLTKWVWQGHAHVLIGNTPADLANALEAPQ